MERRAGGLGLIVLAGGQPCIWAVMRNIQIGIFCGREHGTDARALDTNGAVFGRNAGTSAARA